MPKNKIDKKTRQLATNVSNSGIDKGSLLLSKKCIFDSYLTFIKLSNYYGVRRLPLGASEPLIYIDVVFLPEINRHAYRFFYKKEHIFLLHKKGALRHLKKNFIFQANQFGWFD